MKCFCEDIQHKYLGIDDENAGRRHIHSAVADLICVPVAKARVEGIPFGGEQSTYLLKCGYLELMWAAQNHLPANVQGNKGDVGNDLDVHLVRVSPCLCACMCK